jgi:hypothetical protein
LTQPLSVVHVFIACQAAVHRLAEQIGQGKLRVLSPAGVGQVLGDEVAQTQALVQFPHQNQASVRGNARSLEVDLQGSFERELKGLILALTDWVWTSGVSLPLSNLHQYR